MAEEKNGSSERLRKGQSKSQAREERRLRASRKKSRRRTLYLIGGGSVAALLILSLLLPNLPFGGGTQGHTVTPTPTATPGEGTPTATVVDENVGSEFLDQGDTHITFGSPHPRYNSTPPTSGWHYDTPAPWGVYETALPNETFIHNMEHGGIVFSYNLTDEAQIAALQEFVEGPSNFPGCLLMQPYEEIDEGTISLTAWTWLQSFAEVDTKGMQTFVDAHRNRGPEQLGPNCGGSNRMVR